MSSSCFCQYLCWHDPWRTPSSVLWRVHEIVCIFPSTSSLIGSVHNSGFNANGCMYTCPVPDVKVQVKVCTKCVQSVYKVRVQYEQGAET